MELFEGVPYVYMYVFIYPDPSRFGICRLPLMKLSFEFYCTLIPLHARSLCLVWGLCYVPCLRWPFRCSGSESLWRFRKVQYRIQHISV